MANKAMPGSQTLDQPVAGSAGGLEAVGAEGGHDKYGVL